MLYQDGVAKLHLRARAPTLSRGAQVRVIAALAQNACGLMANVLASKSMPFARSLSQSLEKCLSKWESQFKMWIAQQMLEPLAVLGTWAAILSAKGTLQKCCIGAKVVDASLSSDRMPQATFQGKPLVKNSQSSVEAIMDLKKAVAVLQKHHRRQHHRCPV